MGGRDHFSFLNPHFVIATEKCRIMKHLLEITHGGLPNDKETCQMKK